MSVLFARFRRKILGISVDRISFDQRGFPGRNQPARSQLERIGRAFIVGYHAALADDDPDRLPDLLGDIDPIETGFAFEGAAMAFTMLDHLLPWRRDRFLRFIEGQGIDHIYMAHIGAGWALARLPVPVRSAPRHMHELYRWLVIDGYGFHEGFFHWEKCFRQQHRPANLRGYAQRAFDQGLGRSLWFVQCAEPEEIARVIQCFNSDRRGDLWSGIGLACAYAGGAPRDSLQKLMTLSGECVDHLTQGVAFAVKARHSAKNPAPHTTEACKIICEMNDTEAAAVTDKALESLEPTGDEPAFEIWRQRIRSTFFATETAA